MTFGEIFLRFLIVLIGGLSVYFITQLLNKSFEKKSLKNKKILTDEIVEQILPERNYNKVQEILGIPDKTTEGFCIFDSSEYNQYEKGSDNEEEIKSDIYFMSNAYLKVVTLDGTSIYAITIIGFDDDLSFPEIFYPCENESNKLNRAIVCKEIINEASNHHPVRTIRDNAFAIQNPIGPRFYRWITYFTYDNFSSFDNYDIDEVIGNNIDGFCLASGEMAFYIYEYEMR